MHLIAKRKVVGLSYGAGIASAAVLGGTVYGLAAASNGRDFWTGKLLPSSTPAVPSIPSQNMAQLPAAEDAALPKAISNPDGISMPNPSGNIYELDYTPPLRYNPEGIPNEIPDQYRWGRFRDRLSKVSGLSIDPSEAQAHHVFPVKYGDKFRKVGIEPNNYGAWWATDAHRSNSSAYNKAWDDFWNRSYKTNITREDCFKYLDYLRGTFNF